MKYLTEDPIETYALECLQAVGYTLSPNPSPRGRGAFLGERETFGEVVLKERLRNAINRLNPHLPPDIQRQGQRELLNIASPDLLNNNQTFHRFLTEGVTVEYQKDGEMRGEPLQLIDWETPENNEFLAVNQFTISENHHQRRPDILLFINGLPLVVLELKNAADSKATVKSAYNQLQTYKQQIPSLFTYNALLVISDGLSARAGSLSADYTRFLTWKIPHEENANSNELDILIRGMLNPTTLLDLIRHFTVFEQSQTINPETEIVTLQTVKKVAAYHQYYAVNKAVESVRRAVFPCQGDSPSPCPSPWEGKPSPCPSQGEEKPSPCPSQGEEKPSPSPSQGEGKPSPRPSQGEGDDTDWASYRGGLPITTLLERVRELRKNQTSAEKVFWEVVRGKRFLGLKFRRQHQIGNCIVDFYSHQHRLVIELDGGVHDRPEQQERDRIRDDYLRSLGNRVLRFRNEAIFEDLEGVLQTMAGGIDPPLAPPKGIDPPLAPPKGIDPPLTPPKGRGMIKPLSPWERGLGRGGVVWHTQGSGKSLSMVFLAGKLVLSLDNPTLVVLTDRNDLDDQLFETFAGCRQLLRQDPQQANSRAQVRELLNVSSGGIIFTTVQKFAPAEQEVLYPQISDRPNIVVLADEAHRSQYGFKARQVTLKDKNGQEVGTQTKYGFAKYIRDALPHATFVGFTGTPIEQADKNTPAIFGDYIDIYDIARAVEDGATVPIYYESRLVNVDLDATGRQLLDELDEDLEFEDLDTTQKAKAKQTQLEAIVGSTQRLETIAADMVAHFEERQKVNRGKGMIVTMSRRIAAHLYDRIVQLRPGWHNDDLKEGTIKVVMTANAADGPDLAQHHTTKTERQLLAQRLKDPEDSLELVVVCDMWLTGFDAPCLHTMYIDKPLKGHNLMQAIARINRVYFEKTGGLLVDYLGLANSLKEALAFYSQSGGKGKITLDQEQAVNLFLAQLEIVEQIMAGCDYQGYASASTAERLNLLKQATNHVAHPHLKQRFQDAIAALSKAYSLAVPHREALERGEEVSFFQAIQASLKKLEPSNGTASNTDMETAIRLVVDQALVSNAVVNIFDEAGIKTPDLSIISDEFMEEVRGMECKNLAVELLTRLLKDDIKAKNRTNLVQSRKLSDMLEDSLHRYQNQVISVVDVIDELLAIAKEAEAAQQRGEELGLEPYEMAFYDALAQNKSAREVMGKDQLRELAIVLTERIRKNASIDWNLKSSIRARMKVMVKRLLKKYGYPPDMQALATELVLEQAEGFTEAIVNG
jgi:type I site-specific restriction-modification system R (restriction) subunit/very-short-patch-repair endonuclease